MTLVVGADRRLGWIGRRSAVSIAIAEPFDPKVVVPHLSAGPDVLMRMGLIGARDGARLRAVLRREGILECVRGAPTGIHSLPLSAVIMRNRAGSRVEGTFATTAGIRGLWLAPDTATEEAHTLLWRFVSALPEAALRAAYGACLQRDDVAVLEDAGPWHTIDGASVARLPHAAAVTLGPRGSVRILGLAGRRDILAPCVAEARDTLAFGVASVHVVAHRFRVPTLPADPFVRIAPRHDVAIGSGRSRASARERAVSEMAERFALSALWATPIVTRPAHTLGEPFLHPEAVYRCSRAQATRQGLASFDEEADEPWLSGWSLTDPRRRVWVPAQLVACGDKPPPWLPAGALNSSGTAAHSTREGAVRAALAEAIERDAFLRMWLSSTPAPRLDESALPSPTQELLAGVRQRDGVMDAGLVRLQGAGGVPVVIAVALGPVGVCIGSAASKSVTRAAHKAAIECALQVAHPAAPVGDRMTVRAPLDHAGYHRNAKQVEAARWLLCSAMAAPRIEPTAETTDSAPDGVAVLLSNRTFPQHVVARVLCPRLLPMWFGYDQEPSGHPALRAILGQQWSGEVPLEPHPFA